MVDLCAATRTPDPEALRIGGARLRELACPAFALAPGPPAPPFDELRDVFDLVVASQSELEPVLETVTRAPLASLALVQLLRQSQHLDVYGGLVAESLVYATLQSGPEFASWLASRPEKPRRAPPLGPAVRVRRRGDEVRLTLNRPAKRNAFSAEMRDALCEGLHLVTADPSIRRLVLDGAGPAFCSGGDLDEFGTLPDPAQGHAIRSTRNAARLLAECAPRARAEIHGACVGAGIELPAFAARVVAREDTTVLLPELRMGLVPGAGGTVSLPRRIGRQRTAWLALSGRRLDAETALRWGLVDELRPSSGEPC